MIRLNVALQICFDKLGPTDFVKTAPDRGTVMESVLARAGWWLAALLLAVMAIEAVHGKAPWWTWPA